jgi:D-3-phosphoglycerate dehydrogenase
LTDTKRFSVVHTDARDPAEYPVERDLLAAFGAELVATNAQDEEGLIAATRDADAILVVRAQLTRRVIENLRRCRLILRKGVGYDTIDVAAATEHGIPVCTLPDIWTDEVANHTLALLLGCNRRLLTLDRAMRSGGWRSFSQTHTGQLRGETLGIIGLGRIGSAVARRVLPFGMEVIAYDPYIAEPPPDTGARLVPALEALLSASDYVSVHTPLAPDTFHLIGEAQLRQMKPTAYLINTARGPIIDEAALVRALREGWIAGAGIDAFEQEPPAPSDPLLTLDNVILTPHNAFYSDPAVARMHRRSAEEVIEALSGRWPSGLLNTELRRAAAGSRQ